MTKKKTKALVLFSGGLDSCLAYKILERQGIEVEALIFTSFFFDSRKPIESAKKNKFKFKVEDISLPHFGIVRKPKFGYGGAMNPCIDCHSLMIEEAGKIAKKEGYDFVATGEVLGQRPMSQNKKALEIVEKSSGLKGKLLRPLSALKLPETEMEKTGLVDRKKLLGISGRSRREQIKLAKEWGIESYPAPGGGCVLTEKEYSKKLENLLKNRKDVGKEDLKLLQVGRHFWQDKNWFIVGRNKEDGENLEKLSQKGDILVELKEVPGPLVLLRGTINDKSMDKAKEFIIKYLGDGKRKRLKKMELKIREL